MGTPWTPVSTQAEIVRRYLAGEGSTFLSREYGLDKGTIQNIVRRSGAQLRKERGFRLPVNHQAFDVLTPSACYWAGVLMADGCVSFTKSKYNLCPRLILNLAEDDGHHVARFRDFIESAHKLSRVSTVNPSGTISYSTRLSVGSWRLCLRLIQLGITEQKTKSARASHELVNKRDFWRGVSDGDGCVHCTEAKHDLLGSEDLCHQYKAHMEAEFPGEYFCLWPRKGCWCVSCYGPTARKVLSYLYRPGDVCLLRKMLRARYWSSGNTFRLGTY